MWYVCICYLKNHPVLYSAVWSWLCLLVRWRNPQAQRNVVRPVKSFCSQKYGGLLTSQRWNLTASALLEQCLEAFGCTRKRETCKRVFYHCLLVTCIHRLSYFKVTMSLWWFTFGALLGKVVVLKKGNKIKTWTDWKMSFNNSEISSINNKPLQCV